MDQQFEKLFAAELADLYDAENQILKALPKIIEKVSSPELQEALENHRIQTEGHVRRLDEIFENLGERPTKKCKGMAGLLAEGEETMKEDFEDHVMDAAIIGDCQRVEHYEIAAYGTARTFANFIGNEEAVRLLEETLDEEKEADSLLTQIAESHVNMEAAGEEGEEEEEQTTRSQGSRNRTPSRSTSRTGGARAGSSKTGSRSARSKR
jgi:ferritin-like metal-binding protein YciE